MLYRKLSVSTPFGGRQATDGFYDAFKALQYAVSDSRRYLMANKTAIGASSKVYIDLDGHFQLSLLNVAHASDDLFEEAAWFEVGLLENGRLLETADGGDCLFNVRYNHFVPFFEAVKQATKDITRMGLWTALYRFDVKCNFEQAKRAYIRAFNIQPKKADDGFVKAETAEEMAYQTKYVYFLTRFNQTGDKADKAKADFLLEKLRLMVNQRLAHQG